MGKSTAGVLLSQNGVELVDTDQIARDEVLPGKPALVEIEANFGSGILNSDGSLNRKELGKQVFGDSTLLSRLESILHPRIAFAWRRRVDAWRNSNVELAAVVIPLLFEKDYSVEFDAVVCLACSATTQRRRLLDRGWSPDEVNSRIGCQLPIQKKMDLSQFVVWTEGSLESHHHQWRAILGRLGRE
jgi:dephospho-CoA kinase